MNKGRRFMFKGYTFAPGSSMPIVKAIASWAFLELKEGWRSWFGKEPETMKDVAAMPAKVAMKPSEMGNAECGVRNLGKAETMETLKS
jgi:hypothetical protein